MPCYTQGVYPIVKRTAVAKEMYDVWIHCPEMAEKASAGQFVHVKCEGFSLRRPISICEIDREKGCLRIVYQIRGEGTKKLSQLHEGDLIDVMGPLGNGFSLTDCSRKAVFVGGGIGVPPLLEAGKFYGENAVAILGFRDAAACILEEDFARIGAKVSVTTDDGSRGHHGFVTDVLKRELENGQCDVIYACGPMAMLKNVAKLADEFQVECQVSLEQRMACGVGACLVCACKTHRGDGSDTYSHVCKDGPVFDSKAVDFDE